MSHKCRRYWGLDIQRQSALDFTRYNMAGKSRHVSVGQQRITAVTPFSCMRLMWRCTAAVESSLVANHLRRQAIRQNHQRLDGGRRA
jgi:hypothetical protein